MMPPEIKLSAEEFKVIHSVIYGYVPYLLHKRTSEAYEQARILSRVRVKLFPLLQPGILKEGTALPLTEDELLAVSEAITGFARLLPLVARPSKERAAMIEALHSLSEIIRSSLSP